MSTFTYRALRTDGTMATGTLEATGRQEAMGDLDRLGLQPVELISGKIEGSEKNGGRGVSAKVLEMFTRQLASLLSAGVPLAEALRLLCQEGSEAGREHWQAVHDDVIDGCALAEAFAHQPKTFPSVYVAMVRAGETGGFLEVVLRQIAAFQNRDRELRSRVYGSMIYPAVLALLAVVVVTFLMVFFIPRFQGIFADFGAALPPLTNFIVQASVLIQHYGLLIFAALVVVFILMRRYLHTPHGRYVIESATLRLPVIGTVAGWFAMTRFCRMLGTLTEASVPLIQSLGVARESLGNEILAEAVDTAIEHVQHGERLGASLATCSQLFPASTVAMITIAEQSGRLGEELIRIADDAEQELDRRLRAAVTLAEPALLFVMAVIVGLIVIGMVLPIFSIQDYIN